MNMTSIAGGDGVPSEPDWRSLYADELDVAEAHDQWGIVTREMSSAGTLVVANEHAIQRLIEFRVIYQRSSRHVAEHGPILKAKRAKVGQWNPHWSAMRQASAEITVLEARLGLDPVARGKATKVQRAKKAPRAADAYLKAVPK